MNHPSIKLSQSASLLLAACLGLASASALAQSASAAPDTPEARYQSDMELCRSGRSDQPRATCEREAGAALQAARRGKLPADQASSYEQDATKRCASLPEGQRQDCMTLMGGSSNVEVQGSVGSGGILRTTTVTVPG